MTKNNTTAVNFAQSIVLLFLYCVPVFLVLAVMLASYHNRAEKVAIEIAGKEQIVKTALDEINGNKSADSAGLKTQLLEHSRIKPFLISENNQAANAKISPSEELIRYYVNIYSQNPAGPEINIHQEVEVIWLRNSAVIVIMTLFPYLMLGGTFAFAQTLNATYNQRRKLVHSGLWMKLIVAVVITYGWLYIMNPVGRGGTTIAEFLISVDFSQSDTLPLFLRNFEITPVIAAFLGWYLYLLTYFFSKMTTIDVVSSQAYGALLQKFLFTWGITIVFVAIQVDKEQANLVAFLIGFFPMSVFSLIKDKGMSMVQGNAKEEAGQLIELPGISRWQILRLEEEGINSMGALAYHPRQNIKQYLPGMAKLADYWADIARLYTIVGPEKYNEVKKVCLTASEFVLRSDNQIFNQTLEDLGVKNSQEIARLLMRTFPDLLRDEESNKAMLSKTES